MAKEYSTPTSKRGKKLKRDYQFKFGTNIYSFFNLFIMKKNLLYALTAVAMLTGCAKSDVVDSEINKESNQIGFSTYKNISRGNPVDDNTEFLKNGYAFGVTAFISTSLFTGKVCTFSKIFFNIGTLNNSSLAI